MPSEVKLIPAIYMGLSGKGRAVRAIFEAASFLKVKSVALVDSDLRSITPEWMQTINYSNIEWELVLLLPTTTVSNMTEQ